MAKLTRCDVPDSSLPAHLWFSDWYHVGANEHLIPGDILFDSNEDRYGIVNSVQGDSYNITWEWHNLGHHSTHWMSQGEINDLDLCRRSRH